nr:EOG090X03YR [Ilyocryptus agilis]
MAEPTDDMIARGERWAPLGADEDIVVDNSTFDCDDQDYWQSYMSYDSEKLRLLEEEQEELNSSLMALTSHFAQVQFRLKQIVDAEPDAKEALLKELEEFAFRGIPDFQKTMRCVEGIEGAQSVENSSDHATKMESHKIKQHELIEQLKQQLQDLEQYAYETGEAGPPQTLVVERQKVVIDQMKSKLEFNIDDLDKYTVEELKQQVDKAISQLVNPLKMKEQLVAQLKTQISDLERFIGFLQGPAESHCHGCATKNKPIPSEVKHGSKPSNYSSRSNNSSSSTKPVQLKGKNVSDKVNQVLHRITDLLQMFIISQFGCGLSTKVSREMPCNDRNRQLRDGLSRLNGAVLQVVRTASVKSEPRCSSTLATDKDNQVEIIKAVRKGLCPALRDLLSHGLAQASSSTSLVPFLSCAAPRAGSSSSCAAPHPWQLFVAFYRSKDGQSLMKNPQRSLAQSFSLEIQGGTSKQLHHNRLIFYRVIITSYIAILHRSLLVAIGNVIALHQPFKRGPEAHFKAFLSRALNSGKIVPWLRIVLRSPSLLDEFYEPWAYVANPGFDDIWKVLEPLQSVKFQLPEDLSVRSLRNIEDAF